MKSAILEQEKAARKRVKEDFEERKALEHVRKKKNEKLRLSEENFHAARKKQEDKEASNFHAARKKQEDKEEKLCLSQKLYSARKKQEEEAMSPGSTTPLQILCNILGIDESVSKELIEGVLDDDTEECFMKWIYDPGFKEDIEEDIPHERLRNTLVQLNVYIHYEQFSTAFQNVCNQLRQQVGVSPRFQRPMTEGERKETDGEDQTLASTKPPSEENLEKCLFATSEGGLFGSDNEKEDEEEDGPEVEEKLCLKQQRSVRETREIKLVRQKEKEKKEKKEEKLRLEEIARKKQEEEEDAKTPNSLQEAGSQLTKFAKKSDVGKMSRLIDAWPDCVHWQNNYGCTALHYACMSNNISTEVAKMLVSRDADLNLRNKGIPGHPNHSSPKTPMELSDAGLRKQLTLLKEQINQKCQEEAEKAEKIAQEAREAMKAEKAAAGLKPLSSALKGFGGMMAAAKKLMVEGNEMHTQHLQNLKDGGQRGMPEKRVLMLGLDGAGKTTLLYKLKYGEIITTIPT